MFNFGTGVLIGTPTMNAAGTAITTASPIQLGTLQGVTVDLSADVKKLYGNLQYPVAAGRGQGTATITAKFATINAALFNAFIFGQTMNSGMFSTFVDATGQAIPDGGEITITAPTGGTYAYDLGVQDGAGVPYTRVAADPAAGQYTVDEDGVYQFATADEDKKVFISYNYATSGSGQNVTVANLPMGYAPFLQVDIFTQYAGKAMTLRFPQVMAGGITLDMVNDDFTIPSMTMEAFADSNGNICHLAVSE